MFTRCSVEMVCALWRVLPKKGDTKILLRLAGRCWSVLRIIVMVAEWFCKAMCDFEPEISFSNLLSYKFYCPNKSSSDRNNNFFFLPAFLTHYKNQKTCGCESALKL